MVMNLSPGSILIFGIAGIEAQAGPCTDIFPEHVFLAMCKACDLEEGSLEGLAEAIGTPFSLAHDEVSALRKLFTGADVDTTQTRRRLRKLLRGSLVHNGPFSGHRSESCRRICRRAEDIATAAGSNEVAVQHLLLAFREEDAPLVLSALSDTNGVWTSLDRLIAREARVGAAAHADDSGGGKHPKEAAKGNPSRTPTLDELGRDLTALAKSGGLAPCIGRKSEIRAVAQVLLRQTKNSPVLVGDPGVGKTCIVEGLALRVVAPNAPSVMRGWRIVEVSVADLIAGCMYRGQFEERLRKMISEAQTDRNVILFMDELHTLAGAGGGSDKGMDAGQILKPALGRGDIRLIGATTTAEYRKYIEPDAALERRFQLVWVNEPSREETIEILEGLRERIEGHHGIVLQPGVLEKAVEWSMRYLPDHRLPDKAIDLIDQACSTRVLQTLSSQRPSQDGVRIVPPTPQTLSIDDIAKVVSARCRVPVGAVSADETAKLMHLEEALSERVLGQEAAIKEVAEAVRTARAGLKKANRPIGVFLFLGSTGIGKTELAKVLAQSLFGSEDALIRFDMSEFSEKHNVARLIGAPPGYIGYGEEGQLTGKVRTRPYCVVLFDEVEKAHPSVFDIFLQMLDEGQLTDAMGRRALLTESIIILTSNLGTGPDDRPKRAIGIRMGDEEHVSSDAYRRSIEQAVQRAFRPELLNRITHRIVFSPLTKAVMLQILDKLIAQLKTMLQGKSFAVEFSDQAKDFLLQEGHWDVYGARELERTFERLITTPLAREILEGKSDVGATICVAVAKGRLSFLKGDASRE